MGLIAADECTGLGACRVGLVDCANAGHFVLEDTPVAECANLVDLLLRLPGRDCGNRWN